MKSVNRSILVVDDNAMNRDLLVHRLARKDRSRGRVVSRHLSRCAYRRLIGAACPRAVDGGLYGRYPAPAHAAVSAVAASVDRADHAAGRPSAGTLGIGSIRTAASLTLVLDAGYHGDAVVALDVYHIATRAPTIPSDLIRFPVPSTTDWSNVCFSASSGAAPITIGPCHNSPSRIICAKASCFSAG